eukprot:278997_1
MSNLQAKYDEYVSKYGSAPNATHFKKFAAIKYSEASQFVKTAVPMNTGRNRSISTMRTHPKVNTSPPKSLIKPAAKRKPKSAKTKPSHGPHKQSVQIASVAHPSNPYIDDATMASEQEGAVNDEVNDNQNDENEIESVRVDEGSDKTTIATHESPNMEEINNIVDTLDVYHQMMSGGKGDVDLVNKIDIVGVMDSFNHLLPQENINKDIEIITSSLNHCNMSNCNMYRRTYRDRSTLRNSAEISQLYGFHVSDGTESVIAKLDDGLSDYYQEQQMNYFVDGNRGKFMKFCEENCFDDDTVKRQLDYLKTGVEDCVLPDFDPMFPLNEPTDDKYTRTKLIMDILNKILVQNSTNAKQEVVDTKYITYCEMMDKIHCFIQHSFDIGNILTPKEQEFLNVEDEETEAEEMVILINRRLVKLRRLLQSKNNAENGPLLSSLKERMRGKYNQDNMLRRGWQIQYNDLKQYRWGKHILGGSASQSAEEKTDDFVSINVIQILPKYYNLKHELTQNMIALITTFQFEAELQKARMNWNTQYR